ncbi:MAG TPA: VWA domain-containing protein [Bacteroidia bacterium]|nr:VWA domain-containing protein [Bacteroidia bacterium]
MRLLRFILLFLLLNFGLVAQVKKTEQLTRILFVFDASRSMVNTHGPLTRMEGAKKLFYKFVDSLSKQKNMQFALRMYGHTVKYPPGNCNDSKLIVPFAKNNLALIKQKVSEAKPTGITPIEHSLTQAANDFPDNKAVNMIIIITDGIEECAGDPCKARQKLMEKGIVFKPFIIGIGLTPEQIKTFECVGSYYDYDNANTFSSISDIIIKQKLNKTSAQVNLLDITSKPSETNVNMTFYDVNKKQYVYNYIHTLNYSGNPDTLYIDDYPTYKVVAHTIPPTESKEVKLTVGKHTLIPIDAPQGFLQINRAVGVYNYNEKIKCVVRKGGDMQTINVQQLNTTEKYIVGNYDLEILTLPRTYISSNQIEQSKTKSVDIASAGLLSLKSLESGDGCIMQEKNNKVEWVCNLTTATQQSFYLQPGNYRIEWRSKSLRGSIYTIEKKFNIRSDQETKVDLYK